MKRFSNAIARHEQEEADLRQSGVEKALNNRTVKSLPVYKRRAWFFKVMKRVPARRK
ncbi:hypothetical protein [Salsuginibacillus kocurii]|uniref:hypothetical protein n=1 Tax=Salsuginibacillus kocurii TaxID=427078 RepID=UPI000399C68E|nr:hypothetical protein [Salsuginibacillus kocurii]